MRENPIHANRVVEYGHLIAHQTLPPSRCKPVDGRPVRVRAKTYAGDITEVEAPVVAVYKEWVCIAQDDDGGTWNAWVHRSCVSRAEG